jgi:hypothetical protein
MRKFLFLLPAILILLSLNTASARDCQEILFSGLGENWNLTVDTYKSCLLQDYLESSPYKQYYNNSLLNDNAGIISSENEILPLLESFKPEITITVVTINSSNVSEEMVSYLMLASNTPILLLANNTQLLAFYKDNESAKVASYAMEHAYGKTAEQKILSALRSLQERRFLETNFQPLVLLLLVLFSFPFLVLLLLTPKAGMPLKLLSCLASFILASSFTPSALLPGELLFAKHSLPEPIKTANAQAYTAPVLFFSDLTSGPKTGWEGSSTKGAAVTIWGKNFGATRGSNYVTVNGVQLTSDSDYAEWGLTGAANGIARGLERTTFWLNSNCADGAGTITVTVNGVTSNSLPFTVRSGNIYFISVSDGSTSYNGKFSTHHTGSDGPWKDLYMAMNEHNSAIQPGAVIYVKGGTYTTGDPSESSSFMDFRSTGDAGTAANPIVLTAYPGEVPIANLSGKGHGFCIGDSGCDTGQGCQNYWTIAKIKMINGTMGPNIRSHHMNIVGCWFSGITGGGWAGIIDSDVGSYVNIYGNYFYNCGNTDGDAAYTHTIYLNGTQGTLSNYNVRYNEFDHDTYASYYGGELDIRAANHIDISENYWHDGSNQPLYLSAEGGSISYIYFYNNIASNMNIMPSASDPAGGEYCLHLNDLDTNSLVYNNIFYNCPINSLEAVIGVYGAFSSHSYAYLKNNIIYGSSPSQPALYIESSGTFNSANDLYYNVAVPSGSGVTITNRLTSDPLFVANGADFHLQSTSPARDSGTSAVSSIVTEDYDGASRPQGSAYDIGAYEYYTGTCTPNCAGKVCGNDGCGGSCGTCAGGYTCNASGQCILLDTIPPSITFVFPTPTNATNVTGNYIQVNVSLSEAPGACLLNWYSGAWANSTMAIQGLSCYRNMTGLANGTYQFRVYANDTSGNMNISATRQNMVSYSAPDTSPPGRSGGSPSGTLPAGTTSTTISLTTNESATCRYSTNSGISYPSMANTFSTTGGTSHSQLISGLQNSTSYNYYVKCNDTSGNYNLDDYTISFSVASSGGACIHESDNNPCDGCVNIGELNAYIDRWKVNNQDVTLRKLMEAIGFWKAGTGCTVPTCSEGQITSTCTCGGSVYSSGYCCSGVWQSTSCGVTPNCASGQPITSPCMCESATRTTGYCCFGSDWETLGPCCPNGPITSSCYCENWMVSSDYCCDNVWSSGAC